MSRASSEPCTGLDLLGSKGEERGGFDLEIRHKTSPEGLRTIIAIMARLMAVPKRKTSKARRDQRRAQHKIEAPRVNVCPQCGSPKRAHRVCPTCGTYKGREVEPLRFDAP
jgi:large subunit ribosomal protein L32